MKIVYTGEMERGGTCHARMRALARLATELHCLDYNTYWSELGRLRRALEMRLFYLPGAARMNRDLLRMCELHRPNLVWVDKGTSIWPSTLRKLRTHGILLVQYNTDALYHRSANVRLLYALQRAGMREYDMYFTTNLDDYATMHKEARPRTEMTYLGYDHERFTGAPLAPEVDRAWSNPLVFAGHYEPSTEAGILALARAGLPVKVFGPLWQRCKEKNLLAPHVAYRRLNNDEYTWALKAASIGLCFVSRMNGNQTAARSFEIPGSGTFLLAQRTPQHLECYQEGEEAEFFGSDNELVEKATFYLQHHSARETIARRGAEKCRRSFSWEKLMRDDWQKVLEHYDRYQHGRGRVGVAN